MNQGIAPMRWNLLLASLVLAVLGTGAFAAEVPQPAKPDMPWAFSTPHRPTLPAVRDAAWIANPIDRFILARLEAEGLSPRPRAARLTLLRRVTLDLTGLPPTLEEQEAFLADSSADAYRKVVDRLLDSPRYGERWARHWLDLVRYAETDGFKADDHRPNAFRYRDYVIRALNADLPYDRFVRQQLAGDELEPDNPDALIATGFNRLWPDEYNAANLEQRRQEILDDMTDVTGLVFLGLTVGCARCHDHKFDPIPQADYFRLQAFFASFQPRDDLMAADPAEQRAYKERLAAWEEATRALRAEMDALTARKREDLRKYALTKFRPEIQQAYLTPEAQRTPYQQQIAQMAEKQLVRAEKDAPGKLPAEQKKRYQELEQRLAASKPEPPQPLPVAMALTDVGPKAPPTYLLAGGDWRNPRAEVQPGFLECLAEMKSEAPSAPLRDTERRATLARWLTRPEHPLTARVLVNRLWQHHFGRGIVGTPNDFGVQGEAPTHPELLDWLAVELTEHGWSLKYLHRLMVTSAAYCQDSVLDRTDPAVVRAQALDPENKLLWHARRARQEGEVLRDGMLSLSGDLNLRMYGPSARPRLPESLGSYSWKPDARVEDQNRRSVYVLAKRNLRYPLFDVFDLPDQHNSCGRRSRTTTAPQALLLLNGDFTLERARRWSTRLLAEHGDDLPALVKRAYRVAFGRPATAGETELALTFLREQAARLHSGDASPRAAAVADFCHALLNANEFLYVD